MSPAGLRRWMWIHTWSSLVCTIFLLLLCITGLPLIFHHEIGHLTGTEVVAPSKPAGTPYANLDEVLATAQSQHPKKVLQYLFRDPNETELWSVVLADTPTTVDGKTVVLDARTARVLAQPATDEGFMYVMLQLHIDMFAGLPGKLFLGLMGILFLAAIISGVVLYAPFMQKLNFGTVRRERATRTHWLDIHNLLGAVSIAWVLVVGATGVINTWADLVVKLWQSDQMAQMTAPYKNLPPPQKIGSLQAAVDAAKRREPQLNLGFVAFPGTEFSSPHHYAVFMRGTEPLTARLFKPVLVDAQTAQVTDSRELPWYVTTVLVAQPLHFGDYGGLPLKIIWALLDIITIGVLGSGVYLWWVRRRIAPSTRVYDIKTLADNAP